MTAPVYLTCSPRGHGLCSPSVAVGAAHRAGFGLCGRQDGLMNRHELLPYGRQDLGCVAHQAGEVQFAAL